MHRSGPAKKGLQLFEQWWPGSGVGDSLGDSTAASDWTDAHAWALKLSAEVLRRAGRARMAWKCSSEVDRIPYAPPR